MKSEKNILISILVVCLYFLWPYFFSSFFSLFNFSSDIYLYASLCINFVLLFIVINIYCKQINKDLNKLKKDFTLNIKNSLKIFMVGLGLYILFCSLFDILGVPILNNQITTENMFNKIPILFILNTLFYYPVIEELVFKMSFKGIFKDKWSFIIFTGVFNALFQIVFSFNGLTDLLYIVPYSAIICSFSYIYYKTDNIIYPIFLRMCYNLIPCIIYFIDIFG